MENIESFAPTCCDPGVYNREVLLVCDAARLAREEARAEEPELSHEVDTAVIRHSEDRQSHQELLGYTWR